jgi:uncharacterized protein Yka (UPF0111/DUF47 family)
MITRRDLISFKLQISNWGKTCMELVKSIDELLDRVEELGEENASLISRIKDLEDE